MTGTDDDRLAELRGALDAVEDVPLDRRPELFAGVNAALVAELARLEEV